MDLDELGGSAHHYCASLVAHKVSSPSFVDYPALRVAQLFWPFAYLCTAHVLNEKITINVWVCVVSRKHWMSEKWSVMYVLSAVSVGLFIQSSISLSVKWRQKSFIPPDNFIWLFGWFDIIWYLKKISCILSHYHSHVSAQKATGLLCCNGWDQSELRIWRRLPGCYCRMMDGFFVTFNVLFHWLSCPVQ